MKVVIIGGETGGLATAKEIRKKDSDCEITIIEKLPYLSYMQYAMPYYISGELEENDLMISSKEEIEKEYNITIQLNAEVVEILPDEKAISVASNSRTNMYKMQYDKLVISVGTIARKLPVFEDLGENIFIHKNLLNANRLKEYIERKNPKSCVIVGAGLIGLELAESFNMLGIDVYIIEKEQTIIGGIDEDISKEMENILNDYVTIIKESEVTSVKEIVANNEKYKNDKKDDIENISENKKLKIRYIQDRSQNEIEVDFAVIGAGTIPATKFVMRADIAVDENDYILVDEYMKTNKEDIYAIGDAVKVKYDNSDINTKSCSISPVLKQAYIVANNITENNNISYSGTTRPMLLRVFGYSIGMVGLSKKELIKNNISYYEEVVLGDTSVPVFSNSEKILLKGYFSKEDRKLLGAIVVGRKDVDKKIDVLSAAIKSNMGANDLKLMELSFTPKLGISEDVINLIGDKAMEYDIGEEN